MKNKNILKSLLPMTVLMLSACGSETVDTDRGDGGDLPDQITQAEVLMPDFLSSGSASITSEDSVVLSFSLNTKTEDNFYIGSSEDNPIESIEFEVDYEDSLSQYIRNYDSFLVQIENLGDNILENGSAQLQFSIEDLPADYGYSEGNFSTLIEDLVEFTIIVENGTRKIQEFSFDYENENELPSFERFQENAFAYNQNESNVIAIPVIENNVNDTIRYNVSVSNQLQYIQLDTSQQCEEKSNNELLGCVIPQGVEDVILNINTLSVSNQSETETFTLTITDGSVSPNEEATETLNTTSMDVEVTVVNSNADLTPSVGFSASVFDISEVSGGEVAFQITPSQDRPDAELTVDYDIDLSGLSIDESFSSSENRIVFSNINIEGDVERVLTLTVTDGEYSSQGSVLVRFVDDIERSPILTSPTSVNIQESTGGTVNYSATLNNSERSLSVSGNLNVEGVNVQLDHDMDSGVFTFSNVEVSENTTGVLEIVANDGVETVVSETVVNFINDIEPELTFPSSITVSEDESISSSFNYMADITNNTQDRVLTVSFSASLPTGVLLNTDLQNQVIEFDTENFRTREDLVEDLLITLSDGVSTVNYMVEVTFENNIDKDMIDFREQFDPLEANITQLLDIDAEREVLDFYADFSKIYGVEESLVDDYVANGREVLDLEAQSINDLVSDIQTFITNTQVDTLNPDFDNAYALLSTLSDEAGDYGGYTVSNSINGLALENGVLPVLSTIDNTLYMTGVYGRYIGNTSYGSVVGTDGFVVANGYKFLELVDPNKNICN